MLNIRYLNTSVEDALRIHEMRAQQIFSFDVSINKFDFCLIQHNEFLALCIV